MDPGLNIDNSRKPTAEVVAPIGTVAKWATTTIIVLPFLATILAMYLAWGGWFYWHDVIILAVLYFLTAAGITVGFHRHFTHGAFKARQPVRFVMAVLGSLAIEGAIIDWVADHRRHHKHSDREGDPHSPHVGFKGHVLKGLIHAHFGWLVKEGKTNRQRFAPDLENDRMINRIDSAFLWLWLPLTFIIPAVAGLAITGTLEGMFLAVLWGGLVRIFLVHHVTWSINSICHMFGKHEFESKDFSTNVTLLALPTLGESGHNFHHAFPKSAAHSDTPREQAMDVSWQIIRFMKKLGWVWDVKLFSKEAINKKRVSVDN